MKNLHDLLLVISMLTVMLFSTTCEKKQVPVLTTSEVSNITGTTASSGGSITDEGSGTVISRGVCWSTETSPTIADNKTSDGAGVGTFTSNLTDLNGATKYFVRAYATNNVGTGYGMAMSFTTLGELPSAVTQSATNVTTSSTILNGIVNANHLSTTVTFEYGVNTTYGLTITTTPSPVSGNSNTSVKAEVTGLTPGTIYHFSVKSVNSLGTTYGNDMTFTTLGKVPTAITLASSNKTNLTAQLNGTINANYLSTIVTFEYGTNTNYGNSVTAIQSPLSGNSTTNVNAIIVGLTPATIYHYRLKATNSLGTTTGNDMEFTTEGIRDNDDNVYSTVLIGTQLWMKENLKATKFNDGTDIPLVTEMLTWGTLTTPAYCWYNNDATNGTTYGALYNWYSVSTGKLCPMGWHVPTDGDWTILTTYLGGESVAGGKIKETGTTNWQNPNVGATNVSGFTALPGGNRYSDGTFGSIAGYGGWWSTLEYEVSSSWVRVTGFDSDDVYRGYYEKTLGFSVRCIKD